MDDFMPATVVGYSEWPKTPELLGAAGNGRRDRWTYRKDWFARPEIQAESRRRMAATLALLKLGMNSN